MAETKWTLENRGKFFLMKYQKGPMIEHDGGIITFIGIMPSEERIKDALRFERRKFMLQNPRTAQRYLDKYYFHNRIFAEMGLTKNSIMYRTARETLERQCRDYF